MYFVYAQKQNNNKSLKANAFIEIMFPNVWILCTPKGKYIRLLILFISALLQ